MKYITLGSTGITVPKNAFGALPIQRDTTEVAVDIVKAAYNGGMTFFDTARAYSDSEHKLGIAFKGVRDKVFIATKAPRFTVSEFWEDLNKSLEELQTDYIDILQFHNPPFCPKPGDESGVYNAALEAKERGLIKHVGITSHKLFIAEEAIES